MLCHVVFVMCRAICVMCVYDVCDACVLCDVLCVCVVLCDM